MKLKCKLKANVKKIGPSIEPIKVLVQGFNWGFNRDTIKYMYLIIDIYKYIHMINLKVKNHIKLLTITK